MNKFKVIRDTRWHPRLVTASISWSIGDYEIEDPDFAYWFDSAEQAISEAIVSTGIRLGDAVGIWIRIYEEDLVELKEIQNENK